jgi:hypothetical protein
VCVITYFALQFIHENSFTVCLILGFLREVVDNTEVRISYSHFDLYFVAEVFNHLEGFFLLFLLPAGKRTRLFSYLRTLQLIIHKLPHHLALTTLKIKNLCNVRRT